MTRSWRPSWPGARRPRRRPNHRRGRFPTAELFAKLPGRHDLIMIAARRLSEETGDYKAASLRTFERMAEAVATRSVPPSVLLECWRQGLGPKSEHKGKVVVAAWKRGGTDALLGGVYRSFIEGVRRTIEGVRRTGRLADALSVALGEGFAVPGTGDGLRGD